MTNGASNNMLNLMKNKVDSSSKVDTNKPSAPKSHRTSYSRKVSGSQIAWYLSVAFILGLMLLLPAIGSIYYFFDLFTHFQGQYFIAMIFLLLLGLLFQIRKIGLSIITLIVILHFAILIHPVQVVPSDLGNMGEADLYYLNALHFNDDTESIEDQVSQVKPEIVAFVEANDQLIDSISQTYGNPADKEGAGALTCVIFSKGEYEDYQLDQDGLIYPVCSIMKERTVILAIHPYPPLSGEFLEQQSKHFKQVKEILDIIQEEGYDFILVGDFNSTFYTRQFREYFGEFHEKNIYSWEADRLWSIPIDHTLSNKDIQTFAAPKTSSDHSAILVDYK